MSGHRHLEIHSWLVLGFPDPSLRIHVEKSIVLRESLLDKRLYLSLLEFLFVIVVIV